jgi:hypothetical protein
LEENNMKKIGLTVAALGVLAVALPSMASAEDVVIKRHDHSMLGARAEYREHRDFGRHEGWRHHDRTVVIKHRHAAY